MVNGVTNMINVGTNLAATTLDSLTMQAGAQLSINFNGLTRIKKLTALVEQEDVTYPVEVNLGKNILVAAGESLSISTQNLGQILLSTNTDDIIINVADLSVNDGQATINLVELLAAQNDSFSLSGDANFDSYEG